MNLRDAYRWAVSGIRAGAAYEKASGSSMLADQLFKLGFDPNPPSGGALNSPFTQHATSYRAIQAFARNVAAMSFELFDEATDELVEDSAVHRLFARPSALMRGTQLFEALTIDLESYGNGIWWLGSPARADLRGLFLPSSIRRLDPTKTKVKLGPGDVPVSYEFRTKSDTIVIPAEEVLHFKYWNPLDESWGISWTSPAGAEIETDANAGRWARSFFHRGAEPGVVLMPDGEGTISPESAERIRQSWIARHAGIDRAHAPAILPKGLKMERTGLGQRDMDFNNGRRFLRENTLSTAGVPPAIAGILEYANYANMMPQLRIFFHLELLPRLRYIEDVIQTDFLDRFKTGLEGMFKTEAIMALVDEINTKADAAVKLSGIGVPLTHLNERLELGFDLEGVEGADEPRNTPAAAPGGPNPPNPPNPAIEPDDDEKETDTVEEDERAVIPFGRARSAQFDSVWRGLVHKVHDLELLAEARWRTHLRNLRDETLRKIHPKRHAAGMQSQKTDESARVDGGPAFDLNDANDEAIISLEPIWRASMSRGADSIGDQLGIGIDFHFTDPRVMKLLSNRRQDIRGVNERMLTELHELLAEGLSKRDTEQELRQAVIDYFGGERANAGTVARTETFSAYSGGRFEAMREAKVARHRWVTARDDRVRDSHAELEGEVEMVGARFSNGLEYPLDPAGAPGEVINCRCVTIPEVA